MNPATPNPAPGTGTFWAWPYLIQTDLYRVRYHVELIRNAQQRLQSLLKESRPDWRAIQAERIAIHQARRTLSRIRSQTPYPDSLIAF